MKELVFKHISYFYTITINDTIMRKAHTTDARLDYKKCIASLKETYGPDAKVWIKLEFCEHWTEWTQGNI